MCTSRFEPSLFYHPLTIKVGPINSKSSSRFSRNKRYCIYACGFNLHSSHIAFILILVFILFLMYLAKLKGLSIPPKVNG